MDDTRLVDTRLSDPNSSTGATVPVAAGATLALGVPSSIAVPKPTLVLDIVATAGTAAGYLVAYPDGRSVPGTDTIDWATGQDAPDLSLATTGGDEASLCNDSSGGIELIVDASGYFAASQYPDRPRRPGPFPVRRGRPSLVAAPTSG